jgi:hypothetical protein
LRSVGVIEGGVALGFLEYCVTFFGFGVGVCIVLRLEFFGVRVFGSQGPVGREDQPL